MPELTPRMAQAKQFIAAHTAQNGHAPTCQEIAAGMGLKSKSGVHRLIEGLEERGHLIRLPKRARSVSVIGDCTVTISPQAFEELKRQSIAEGVPVNRLAREWFDKLLGIEDGGVTT